MNFFSLTFEVNEEFFLILLASVSIRVYPWFISLFRVKPPCLVGTIFCHFPIAVRAVG